MYLTGTFNSIGSIAISGMILLIFPMLLLRKNNNFKFPIFTTLLMYLFLFVAGISALKNGDINLMLNGIVIFSLFLAAVVILPSINFTNKVVYNALFWSHVPLTVIPLLLYGINTNPYRGIFYNPNAFGSIAATMSIALSAVFLFKLEQYFLKTDKKQSFKNIAFDFSLLLVLLFLVVLSGSRTSLLAVIFCLIFGLMIVSLRLIKYHRFGSLLKTVISTALLGVITFLIIKLTPFYDYLYFNIIYKFERKLTNGDVLDTRGSVWEQTLNQSTLFGNGSNYFLTATEVGAHNTFVGLLGEFGWVPTLLFVLVLIIFTFKGIKYAISDINDMYRYLPLISLTGFVLLSMGEGMMFKLIMLIAFFSAGTIFQKHKQEQIIEKHVFNPVIKRKRKRLVWR
ncbi:hypothetical protein NSQ62_14345 [Solibacillus sp. FSL H8-0523]|uniref:hypothetical protein n=1 Tax=Solibacillus sp. FSL H8-0523 TaxID=2954511 RepID=UPI003101165F